MRNHVGRLVTSVCLSSGQDPCMYNDSDEREKCHICKKSYEYGPFPKEMRIRSHSRIQIRISRTPLFSMEALIQSPGTHDFVFKYIRISIRMCATQHLEGSRWLKKCTVFLSTSSYILCSGPISSRFQGPEFIKGNVQKTCATSVQDYSDSTTAS